MGKKVDGSGGIRTHAPEETGALNQRLRPLGHATVAYVAGGIVWVRDQSFGGGAVFQKKGIGTRRQISLAVKSHSTILQRLRRQISLDYYTIPPATQATLPYTP